MSEEKTHPFLEKVGDSPFKDSRNQWLVRALFFELSTTKNKPMFTLKDEDHKGYRSIKKIYLSYDHIPGYEYDFANEILGGWDHWIRLQASPDVMRHIKEWREELDVKIRCEAIRNIIKTSRSADKAAPQAAKYLADKGYIPKDDSRGRPSKSEREGKLKEDAAIDKELQADLNRLGIIQGGRK